MIARTGPAASWPGRHISLAFEAIVEDFAYYGSETHLYLVTTEGMRFAATTSNTARDLTRIERGARRFVSWMPSDTLVLPR